jgi:hypothetical protein
MCEWIFGHKLDDVARDRHDLAFERQFLCDRGTRADSLTSLRTTNVPTAPTLITPSLDNWLAITAGWKRFPLPTFTPRKKTTRRIWK